MQSSMNSRHSVSSILDRDAGWIPCSGHTQRLESCNHTIVKPQTTQHTPLIQMHSGWSLHDSQNFRHLWAGSNNNVLQSQTTVGRWHSAAFTRHQRCSSFHASTLWHKCERSVRSPLTHAGISGPCSCTPCMGTALKPVPTGTCHMHKCPLSHCRSHGTARVP